jgi:hypothetical protein
MSIDITPIPTLTLIDWLREQSWSSFAQDLVRFYDRKGHLTPAQEGSARSMHAKSVQRAAQVPAGRVIVPVTEVGIYLLGEQVYKVVRGRQGGNLYAKALENGAWVYASGAIRRLEADMKLSAEQAAAYGRATGICVCCGAELDDADGLGVQVGIGPVCVRKNYGLTQRQLLAQLVAAGVLVG